MIKFYFVDVSSIQSNVPRSDFSEDQIEQLADMILESEGVLNVILLTQTGINNYIVLAGDLEYYAAVRAKEKNPRQGEMINAVIVQPQNQDTLLKQAEFFTVKPEEVKVIDETSLESRLEKQMREFRELQIEIKDGLQKIENAVKLLTANFDKQITKLVEKPTVTPPPPKPKKSKYDAMTVPQLKEIAKQRDIKVNSKIKKNDLITILSQD
jgi:Rho termination factor, N-terminal domain.